MTDSPGEPFLELPNTRIPEQPPPPNKLLFRLCNNINIASINIRKPLTNDNVPDSKLARIGVTSLNRLRELLTTAFNTPDRIVDRTVWLRFVLEIFTAVHEGLLVAQHSTPDLLGTMAKSKPKLADIANGFSDLTAAEKNLVSTIEEILGWTHDFFVINDESCSKVADHPISTLCYRCVESSHAPFTEADNSDKVHSILLSVDFDARATRDTLLNQAIREVHEEVDAWRDTQRQHLISAIIDMIIFDDPSTETLAVSVAPLDPRLLAWIDSKKADLHDYAHKHLAKQACEDTIDQCCSELIDEHLHQRRKDLDTDVATHSNELQATFDKELANTKLGFQITLSHTKAQMKKTLDTNIKAALLKNHNFLIQETGCLRHEAKIRLQQIKDDLNTRALPSVTRTTKADKPSPLTPHPKKYKKKPPHKMGILDLNTSSPHPSDDEMVTDTESITDNPPSPITVTSTNPTPIDNTSCPTSTTLTQPAFVPEACASTAAPTDPLPEPCTTLTAPLPPPSTDLQLMLAALQGLKQDFTAAISGLNSRVDSLQAQTVPSFQPLDDFDNNNYHWPTLTPAQEQGDAELHATLEAANATAYDTIMKDKAELDNHLAIFSKLYLRLSGSKLILPGSSLSGRYPSEAFAKAISSLFCLRAWEPTDQPTDAQLTDISATWTAKVHEQAEEDTLWAIQELYGIIAKKNWSDNASDFEHFSVKFHAFCCYADIPTTNPIPDICITTFRKFKNRY
jgi:hypothetical protein